MTLREYVLNLCEILLDDDELENMTRQRIEELAQELMDETL